MRVRFEGAAIELLPDETVLAGIERHGGELPAFCRRGVCQTCLVKATRGAVPAEAQKGLKDGLRRQGMFLACVCKPSEELEVERCGNAGTFDSRVERVEILSEQVLRVWLAAPPGLRLQAGQYVHLVRPRDGLMRPYSVASLPGQPLELHVARLPGGAMSSWLATAVGEPVFVRGPFGECFYLPDEPERPLCLAGTGTGLAPLLGVLRAALAAGHRGPVRLYHGTPRAAGLYLFRELQALAAGCSNLRVIGSVLEAEPEAAALIGSERCEVRVRPLEAALLADGGVWQQERVYLCGHQDFVRGLQRKLYLAGVPLARIHADPFVAPAPAT